MEINLVFVVLQTLEVLRDLFEFSELSFEAVNGLLIILQADIPPIVQVSLVFLNREHVRSMLTYPLLKY
jgi:hypothetical protein